MSGGRAARNQASIVNRPTCGGTKKAGLPPVSGYYFLTSKPSIMLRCAPQLPFCPVGEQIPCFPISRTIQTQRGSYQSTLGPQ